MPIIASVAGQFRLSMISLNGACQSMIFQKQYCQDMNCPRQYGAFQSLAKVKLGREFSLLFARHILDTETEEKRQPGKVVDGKLFVGCLWPCSSCPRI